jgi:ABC-2 type transport system ATP-binding protein
MNTLVEARGLVKAFGPRTAVNGLDLAVREGDILAIIGPNGAGKSTTLDMILGIKSPDRGTVSWWCREPKRFIGAQLQSTPFFPGLTALENLRMFAAFYGLRLKDAALMEHLRKFGLEEAAGTDAARLSGGQQKRLAIAMALLHAPKLIFLDEPTSALDPRSRRDVRELIRSLAESGTSVVFTSHDMEEVHKLANRIVLICGGRVAASGTAEKLLSRYGAEGLEELYIRLTDCSTNH